MLYWRCMDATPPVPPRKDTALDRTIDGCGKLVLIWFLLVVLGFALKFWGDSREPIEQQRETTSMLRWACLINAMARTHPEKKLEEVIQETQEHGKPYGVPEKATVRVLRPEERNRGFHVQDFVIEKPPNPIGIRVYSDGETSAHEGVEKHLTD